MTNNEVVRSLQHALAITPRRLASLFALGGQRLSPEEAGRLTLRERDEEHVACTNEQLVALLDGFILDERGHGTRHRRPHPRG